MARITHLPHRHAAARSRVASPITRVFASCPELILVRPLTRHGPRVDTNDSHDTPPECRTLTDQGWIISSGEGIGRGLQAGAVLPAPCNQLERDWEFPQKKDKRKVHEEASSSNTSLEDVLKGFEERLMTCLSAVNGKVEKINKRLGKIKSCQVVLKKRCKRMKVMEKKLEKIEDCQYYLKKKAKKVETLDGRIDGIEKEMKEMKEKEENNENNEGFDYQGMDYDWGGQRNDSNEVDATTKEPEDADMVENTEVVEEKESEEEAQKDDRGDEEESEEEAQKDDRGSEEEKEPEPEAEAEEDKEKEDEEVENEKMPEKEPDEVQDEVEMNEANEIEEEVETEVWL
ncbi:hypothetical protein F2Q68_00024583 [Brassica cretica]|uniref:Uncharacterized protein n=1 Tax=Brassica cretica TaxID=69181 RepID=A0A8S9I7V4_BRACR|nr:hypothetical protein F2Q68_00024583 [Brassica cretica]